MGWLTRVCCQFDAATKRQQTLTPASVSMGAIVTIDRIDPVSEFNDI